MTCERPGCKNSTVEDLRYCSDACFDQDNDPTPIIVLARNKAGGFGTDIHWMIPDAVHLRD